MPPLVARLEVGRYRWETGQLAVGHAFFGVDWYAREHIGLGFVGLGHHWRLDAAARHELGYLVWPLSLFLGRALGNITTQGYYRFNGQRSFVEVGLEFSPLWDSNFLGDTVRMKLSEMPAHLYVSVGLPSAEFKRLWADLVAALPLGRDTSEDGPRGPPRRRLTVTAGAVPSSLPLAGGRVELKIIDHVAISVGGSVGIEGDTDGEEAAETIMQSRYYPQAPFSGLFVGLDLREIDMPSHESLSAGVSGGYKWMAEVGLTAFLEVVLAVQHREQEQPWTDEGEPPVRTDFVFSVLPQFGLGWSF